MKSLSLSIIFSLFALTTLAQGAFDYVAVASGTNTYAANIISPTFPSSYTGTEIRVTFTNANTGASTINISRSTGAIGAAPIRKWDGDSFEALVSGDIPAGAEITLRYNTAGSYFILDSFGKSSGGVGGTVESVTGDGVDNTDPANPVISFPTKSDIGLGSVENTALSTWPGTANVTIIGTIGTGTWNGSIIGSTYGGTGINNSGRTITISTNSGTLIFSNPSTPLTITNTASVSGTNTGDQTTIAGNAGTATSWQTARTISLTGDATGTSVGFDGTANASISATLATVNSNVGTFGSATTSPQFTVNGKGLTTAVSSITITPAVGSITGFGTGAAAALAINVGSAGSIITNGGALATPSSGNASNLTSLPIDGGTTGTLPVNRGGSGAATLTGVIVGNGTSAFTATTSPAMTSPTVTTQSQADGSTKAASTLYVDTGLATKANKSISINTQTANYVLVLTDAGKNVEMNVSTANTVTIPPNSSVAFPIGTIIEISQYNTGLTTLVQGSGVTIRPSAGNLFSLGQYSSVYLEQRATDEWVMKNGTVALSGTYTPTLTNTANIAASTAYVVGWSRVGNMVTVFGRVDIDPTTTLTDTQLGLSLPVASALTTSDQAGGTANANTVTPEGAAILSDATNDRALLQYKAVDVTNHSFYFQFSYQVL